MADYFLRRWIPLFRGVVESPPYLISVSTPPIPVCILMNGGDVFSLKETLGHASLDLVNRFLPFTSAQIRARHREFSPVDRLHHTI